MVQLSSGPDLVSCCSSQVFVHIIMHQQERCKRNELSSGPDPVSCCWFGLSLGVLPYDHYSPETQPTVSGVRWREMHVQTFQHVYVDACSQSAQLSPKLREVACEKILLLRNLEEGLDYWPIRPLDHSSHSQSSYWLHAYTRKIRLHVHFVVLFQTHWSSKWPVCLSPRFAQTWCMRVQNQVAHTTERCVLSPPLGQNVCWLYLCFIQSVDVYGSASERFLQSMVVFFLYV